MTLKVPSGKGEMVEGSFSIDSGNRYSTTFTDNVTSSSITWGVAYRIIYVPVRITKTTTIKKIAYANQNTGTGSVILGYYDSLGNLIIDTGSQSKFSTQDTISYDTTDKVLLPGIYYIAMACSVRTDNVQGLSPGVLNVAGSGMLSQPLAALSRQRVAYYNSGDRNTYFTPPAMFKSGRMYTVSIYNTHGTSATAVSSIGIAPIYARSLNSIATNTDATSYDTASVRMKKDKLYVFSVSSHSLSGSADAASSVSGGGTWTSRSSLQYSASNVRRVSVFTCVPTSDYSGVVTVTFPTTQTSASYAIYELSNVDTSTSDGVVQTATNTGSGTALSVTLSSFAQTQNATMMISSLAGGTSITPKTEYVELSDTSSTTLTHEGEMFYKSDTSPTSDAALTGSWAAIGLEFKASGSSLTFNSRVTSQFNGTTDRASLFSCVPGSDVETPIFIDFGGTVQTNIAVCIDEHFNVDTTTNDGFVQATTNTGNDLAPTITISAFGNTYNESYAVFFASTGNSISGSTLDGFYPVNNTISMLSAWKGYEVNTQTGSMAGTAQWLTIGTEIKINTPTLSLPSTWSPVYEDDLTFFPTVGLLPGVEV